MNQLSRRSFLGLGAASALTGFVAARGLGHALAQEATPAASPMASPEAGAQPLLQIMVAGGFVPAEISVTTFPWFTLYPDGTVITQGPMIDIYPSPALPNLRQLVLSDSGIAHVLAEAKTAGLLSGDAHYDSQIIADGPTTTFTLNVDGKTTVVSAYALGISEEMLPAGPERDARAKLVEFTAFVGDLAGNLTPDEIATDDEAYEIERLLIYASPIDPANPPGADMGLTQTPIEWPVSKPLADFPSPDSDRFGSGTVCGNVEGEDAKKLVTALQSANQLTPWITGDSQYQLWLRPLLPGDQGGC